MNKIRFHEVVITLLLAVGIVACVTPTNNTPTPSSEENKLVPDNVTAPYNRAYRVYTLDSCEYIVVGYGNMQWGSHKGDCKNPKHKK